ncbi:pyoverdine biosynthesis protein PvcA [Pseudomonas sp. FW306-02-F02-AA]|uniref:Pyoverdine biosynthesis protein PvcA n=1 Tax=Pseudomonas fluorescens TaxID=294 RepID=A0A0N7H147_PSEFL|nr:MULTISPECIES: isocyanide synthase family protein [Pseudomonas]ALI04932.1 pyoverdine biosynthesis protein PvcA [Pseudomonas fluorescens]PMZ05655.1 pyoverdine biosynthesis protein PvcA [Pseudomonas sp. FW306-02-F02-AB]PMZ11223.1 pyoverdine biosynthesis protein PvcA [Pseudomonas sp. FW306-02-H06C]PMZ12644.1 pyoverdine biosynthesis protein PvcA [Pseudomonas sp. FW306-02-F02-AA]PMZ23424.1 pyoverdine biosynthesis protein PvcA [Pseudomonas sp. FW306-02-F08-AA]
MQGSNTVAQPADGQLVHAHQNTPHMNIAQQILECLFRRRSLAPEQDHELSLQVLEPHLAKVMQAVESGRKVEMVLPAFPGKSPSRKKTLSHLPDLAEHHAIDELHRLCEEIREIYAPGALIHICSDGYVFSDLVHVPDSDVKAYTDAIQDYADQLYPGTFAHFDLRDAYPQLDCLDAMREEMMIEHGQSLILLQQRFKDEPHMMLMYCGIHRFLSEDYSGLKVFAGMSLNAVKKVAKPASQRVIQRSEAWSALLLARYPHCLRLSIHPQLAVSTKIGIRLVPTSDLWRTPWHSVAIKRRGVVTLEKRSNVDERYHRLVFRKGRPCHYASAQ